VSIHASIDWQHGNYGPYTYYWENDILPSQFAFAILQIEFAKVSVKEKKLIINWLNPAQHLVEKQVQNEYWEVSYVERRFALTNCGDWADAFVTIHRRLIPQWVQIHSNPSSLGDIEYDWPDEAPAPGEESPSPPPDDQEPEFLPQDYYPVGAGDLNYTEVSSRVWRWYTLDSRYPKFLPSTGLQFSPQEWIVSHWMHGWFEAHKASIDAGIIVMLDNGYPIFEPPILVNLMEYAPDGESGSTPTINASPYDFENRGEARIQFGTLRWKQLVVE
jgi:hypothetical protein